MRRFLSAVVINLLAISIATPATLVFAAEEAGGRAPEAVAPAPAAPAAPASLSASIERAAVETAAADRSSALQQQRIGMPMPSKPSGVRYQGGGKSGLVIGLVSTVAGLAATVYMIKYMRDQQKKTE